MLKKVLLAVASLLAIAVVTILIMASTVPSTFRYERQAVIGAPEDVVYAQLEDFHRWGAWSPWEKLDPAMKKTFEGPDEGVGATYAWTGNSDVGQGRMTITDAAPPKALTIKLDFIEPFPATNTTKFELSPADGGTRVNWSMTGDNSFMGKIFCVFIDMDEMIGKDFEKGLASLKQVSEQAAK